MTIHPTSMNSLFKMKTIAWRPYTVAIKAKEMIGKAAFPVATVTIR